MAKQSAKTIWSARKARDVYEQSELAIYQAQTPREIREAYAQLIEGSSHDISNVRAMYKDISPAALVTLALRGYELPNAATRLESNRFLLALTKQLDEVTMNEQLNEQFWLMLAQQQEVLLTHIEDDLQALLTSEAETGETQRVLTALHALIRNRSASVVTELFAGQTQEA